MTYPNFAIIGTAKSGTTSVHYYLEQHPQVYMSPQKETNFFAFEGQEGWFRGPGDDRDLRYAVITTLDAYEKQFEAVSGEMAVGESSTWYLYSAQAAAKMRSLLPKVKLIAMLRNPVDRAFSSYLHLVRENREKLSFEEALLAEEKRIAAGWAFMWHYRHAGFYADQVQRFLDLFGPEQVRFYLYDDLADPASLLADMYKFLGVDPGFVADTSVRHQVTGIPKNRLLGRLLFEPNPVKTVAKKFLPAQFRRNLRERASGRLLSKPSLCETTRKKLLGGYEKDILRLQELIGRDLSVWLDNR